MRMELSVMLPWRVPDSMVTGPVKVLRVEVRKALLGPRTWMAASPVSGAEMVRVLEIAPETVAEVLMVKVPVRVISESR